MKKKFHPKGSIGICVLVTVLIGILCVTLMTFSVQHHQIMKARSTKISETDELYMNLVYYLHQFIQQIFKTDMTQFAKPEIEYFNKTYFPDKIINRSYPMTQAFKYKSLQQSGLLATRVFSTVTLSSNSHPFRLKAGITLCLRSGEIPVSSLPLFLKKNVGVPVETFLENNRITNKSIQDVLVNDIETTLDFSRFVKESLKITAAVMSWRDIRGRLGLPLSDDPIPEDVYIVAADGCVLSIVIQGDVERIIFSIDPIQHLQKIKIIKKSTPYEIHYKPGEKFFLSWNPSISTTNIFNEKILVNGNIWAVESEGESAFLKNAKLHVYGSGKITIHSDLKSEPANFKPSPLPLSRFTVSCGKSELLKGGNSDVGIVVDAVPSTTIQAELITEGTFTNYCTDLNVNGSLYMQNIENNGSIQIDHPAWPGMSNETNYFHTNRYTLLDGFLIDFIEEEINDETK